MSLKFDATLHKRHLSHLLAEIAKPLSEKLAFKGGTCGLLFYNLPRLSFDLDFDILKTLDPTDRDDIREILSKNGVVREFHDKRHTLFFLFDYGSGYPNIKIELNKRIWKNNAYKSASFLGIPMQIVDEATLLTNKIVALTDRKTAVARDLFDSWFFLQAGFPVNEALIQERTELHLRDYFLKAAHFIKQYYNSRNLLQGLGDALDNKQKAWARNHLIPATLDEMKKRLGG